MTFLKANGIRGLSGKNDWPRYTEEEAEMYEQEELDKLFKPCNAEERLWFEFFLMTGMRTGGDAHVLVGCELYGEHSSGQPQAGPRMDPKGIQKARDSDSGEARKETEGMEGKVRQKLWACVSDFRVQPEARLPRLPQGRC
jgi:hypothetical protein